MKKLLKSIHAHQRFLISTHVNPDGDAISSALSTALWLKSLGKTVNVIFEDKVPNRLSFLPHTKMIKSVKDVKRLSYQMAIILDCGDLGRIGKVQSLLQEDKPIINIDHHITNTQFGSINHVLPQSSSTAEVLFAILKTDQANITKAMAQLLYVGMMTDTGSFGFDSTTTQTHQAVAELLKHGFSVAELHQSVQETANPQDAMMFAKIVDHVEFLHKGKLALLTVRQGVDKKFSKDFDLRSKLFAFLRMVKGLEVMAVFTERTKKEIRVNFRSRSYVDVARIANKHNGGGHKRAAGCTVYDSLTSAKKEILKEIAKKIK